MLAKEVGEPHECKDAPAELAEAYTAALEDEVFDSAEILGEGVAPKYKYTTEAAEAGDAVGPALRKALMREARSLQGGQLPLHPDAAIFVRQDEGSMAVLRAVITGPVETPYALGLFTFDIFCPPEYPSIAPLVHFCTTAGGTVKFNPNLYHDGKVCLSLIGTFNSGNSTEKWDPARSSIYQVLMGIQNQILEKSPIVNEPGYDGREDSKASRELNAKLRLLTIRHAMVDQLKAPPAGLEGAVLAHFRTQRRRILRQCWAWTEEAPVELRGKMRAAVAQLHAVLPKAE